MINPLSIQYFEFLDSEFLFLSIEGKDGRISLNGATARLVQKDDLIIIACYAQLDEKEIIFFKPNIVFVYDQNTINNNNVH